SRATGRGWRRRPRSSRLGRAAPRLRAPRRRHRRRSRREGGVRVEVKAVARYVRISPRKVRPVMALIKGKAVDEALAVLRFSPNRASREVAKRSEERRVGKGGRRGGVGEREEEI